MWNFCDIEGDFYLLKVDAYQAIDYIRGKYYKQQSFC